MRLTRRQQPIQRSVGIVTQSRRGIGSHGKPKGTIGKNQPSKKQTYYYSSYDKNRGKAPKQV